MVFKSAADSVDYMDQPYLSVPQVSNCKVGTTRTLLFFFLASFVSFIGSCNHLLLTISTVTNSVMLISTWSQLDPVAVSLID